MLMTVKRFVYYYKCVRTSLNNCTRRINNDIFLYTIKRAYFGIGVDNNFDSNINNNKRDALGVLIAINNGIMIIGKTYSPVLIYRNGKKYDY